MKCVMISIKPKWCELIASGKKTIEVRKTKPKIELPFKCYIYCTQDFADSRKRRSRNEFWIGEPLNDVSKGRYFGDGMVIGEFVCDEIRTVTHCGYANNDIELRIVDKHLRYRELDWQFLNACQLSRSDLETYSGGKPLYGWHISDLVIYDKPKDLDCFMAFGKDKCDCKNCYKCLYLGYDKVCDIENLGQPLFSPPRSWCYCEEWNE